MLGWGQDASVDGSQRLKWVWGSLKLLRVLMRGLASQKEKKKKNKGLGGHRAEEGKEQGASVTAERCWEER